MYFISIFLCLMTGLTPQIHSIYLTVALLNYWPAPVLSSLPQVLPIILKSNEVSSFYLNRPWILTPSKFSSNLHLSLATPLPMTLFLISWEFISGPELYEITLLKVNHSLQSDDLFIPPTPKGPSITSPKSFPCPRYQILLILPSLASVSFISSKLLKAGDCLAPFSL